MTKSIDVLPTWYWPDGVPRYSSMPDVTVYDRAVRRWCRRHADSTAIQVGDVAIDFATLDQRSGDIAARLGAAFPDGARVAVANEDPESAVLAFFGVLRAGGTVVVLDPDGATDSREATLEAFAPDAVLVDDLARAPGTDARVVVLDDLPEPDGPAARSRHDPRRPAVVLAGPDGLVEHSEVSLLRAAQAFAAFFSLTSEDGLVTSDGLDTWQGLVGLLAPLQVGGSAMPYAARYPGGALGAALTRRMRMLWISQEEAEQLLRAGGPHVATTGGPTALSVLVSVGRPWPARSRKQLRRMLRADVLTIYGTPVTGPIAASSPSWYLDEPVGIVMTDVDIVPIDPASRRLSEGPWALLSHAGIGVQTPSLAVTVPSSGAGSQTDDAYYTGDRGRLDANGMLYLL